MPQPAAPLSTQRLGEFLVYLSSVTDEQAAIRVAVERAAMALEAEVAVVLGPGGVAGSVGFAVGQVPTALLAEVVAGRREVLHVAGAGRCHVAIAPLDRHDEGHLVVARSGADGFTADELTLLRGMARALELTLETLRTLAAERRRAAENNRLVANLQQRQRLLEEISNIQRAITRRAPLQDILDRITVGAHRLLAGEVAGLRMRDPDAPEMLLLVSSRGLGEDLASRLWRVPLAEAGEPGQAMLRDELVVTSTSDSYSRYGADAAGGGVVAVMAAPVHENDTVVGALEIASRRPGRHFSAEDQEILRVFAEHVSLAVTDARTHEAMRQAFHDPLTGLASRRLFADRLDHALAAAARSGTRVAVLFVDLDRFKIVNDSLGHAAGDGLLVGVADRVRSCLGEYDMAARLGGDEFAVILADLPNEEPAIQVAKQIIESVREPFRIDGKEAFVEASVGIALDTAGVRCGEDLLSNADLAMYQAKRNGKGRFEVFQPGLRAAFLSRLDLEGDLRHAVERNELVLHYQPIYDLRSGAAIGVEALLRWNHPERGLLPPHEFIPLAEESGLILPIGEWALTNGCRQVGRWNTARPQLPLTLSVNLSVRQLQQVDLPQIVARALAETGFAADWLVLELTESLLLQGTELILSRLQQLKALQVRLAIDDFGTGYSSLAYLRNLPIDIIKIDKSFVADMTNGPAASALARAVVQLGRTLGLVTLAEGIEAADQFEALRDTGCEMGQGYYFARPQSAAATERLLLGG
ncbi:MAG TPA: EAL domain-containing protein [Micromonosporaceae bacterium]|nr:EAL domain-containing protein [Micromonosporaceae bacterium]